MAFQEFTPSQYLKMDIAANFGLDKENWETRLDWFDQNEGQLEKLFDQADEPALYYAGVQAWRKAERGDPVHYPISLDATASGAQLLAILIGCVKSAGHCNVIDMGSLQDLYQNMYRCMLEIEEGIENGIIQDTPEMKICRQDLKDAIMPSFYSSKAAPKRVFGDGTQLYQTFLKVMDEQLPGVWRLNFALLSLWRPDVLEHSWVLPDNFHVHVKVMDLVTENVHALGQPFEVTYKTNQPTEEGRSIGANLIHSLDGMIVREITRRCMFDPQKVLDAVLTLQGPALPADQQTRNSKDYRLALALSVHARDSGFLSARVLDVLSAQTVGLFDKEQVLELLESLPDKPFQVLSVHDCFRVLPNYGNDLRRQYNQILHEIAKSDMLAYLTSQISDQEVRVDKLGDFGDSILESNYALA